MAQTARSEATMTVASKGHSQQKVPKTIFIGEVVSGRTLVEFSIKLENFPGTLKAAADVLSKHKVNIMTGFHDADHWSFFADITESDASSDQLERELTLLKPVIGVMKQDAPNGIIVDSLHYPLRWCNDELVILRAKTLSSMLDSVRRIFGNEGAIGKVMLVAMGEASGRAMFKATAALIGDNITSNLANIMNVYSASGWGIFRLVSVDFNKATARVQAQDNFECAPLQENGSSPRGSFVSGHLAGVFSGIFGKRVQVTETSCIAHGDAYCQFDISGVKQ